MPKPPKLANIETLADFSHWLADSIQRVSAAENAGFVQIERRTINRVHELVVSTSSKVFHLDVAEVE